MTRPIRIAAQISPISTPDYRQWRDVVLRAEDAGVDIILGYNHSLAPTVQGLNESGRADSSDENGVVLLVTLHIRFLHISPRRHVDHRVVEGC